MFTKKKGTKIHFLTTIKCLEDAIIIFMLQTFSSLSKLKIILYILVYILYIIYILGVGKLFLNEIIIFPSKEGLN